MTDNMVIANDLVRSSNSQKLHWFWCRQCRQYLQHLWAKNVFGDFGDDPFVLEVDHSAPKLAAPLSPAEVPFRAVLAAYMVRICHKQKDGGTTGALGLDCDLGGQYYNDHIRSLDAKQMEAISLAMSTPLQRHSPNRQNLYAKFATTPKAGLPPKSVLHQVWDVKSWTAWLNWCQFDMIGCLYDRMTLWPSAVSQISQKTLRLSVLGWNAFEAAPAAPPAAPAPVVELLPFRTAVWAVSCATRGLNYCVCSGTTTTRWTCAPWTRMPCRPFIYDWRTFFFHSGRFEGGKFLQHLRHRNWGCLHHQTDVSMCRQKLYSKFPSPAQTCSKADTGSCCRGLTLLISSYHLFKRFKKATFRDIQSIDTNKSESALHQAPAEVVPRVPENLDSSWAQLFSFELL